MPFKRPCVCSYPSCTRLVNGQYCAEHKAVISREYNRSERDPDHNRVYGRRWREIRNRYYSAHPLCEDCLERGFYVPADEVHHVIPVELGGTHDEANLRSLCRSCHAKTRTRP